ncbi:MAG TPA: DUF6499 domain-containing protein [Xanthobacteraceae bacterium]|nr:DUF6499 domain-containing protein [Xanthobacteraceae bacterium]
MGPDTSRWRSSESYDYVESLIAPDLAWEWLRRNLNYHRDYSAHSATIPEQSTTLIRQRWGLYFPGGPCARGDRRDGVLGTRSRPWHRDSRACDPAANNRERHCASS